MSDTFERLVPIFAKFTEEPITPTSHLFNDLKLDSLDFLDIVFAIEKEFKVTLPVEEWQKTVEGGEGDGMVYTVKTLVDEIDKQRA